MQLDRARLCSCLLDQCIQSVVRATGVSRLSMKNEEMLSLFGPRSRRCRSDRPRLPASRRGATCIPRAVAPGTPAARRCSAASWSPSAAAGRTSMRPWCPTSGNSCDRTGTRTPPQGTSARWRGVSRIPATRASPPRRRTRGRRGRNGRSGWFSSAPGCWPGGSLSRSSGTWFPWNWRGFWSKASAWTATRRC